MTLIEGIIHITGEHDTGKTTFALECGAQPERICLVDDDIKGRATVRNIRKLLKSENRDFGAYHDFTSIMKGKREIGIYEAGLDIINAIQPGQFDVLVWDTWTRYAKMCRAVVQSNPNFFREFWAAMGRIKGAEENQEAGFVEATVISLMAQKVPLVVLVTHLKSYYLNNQRVPGKEVSASSRTLNRVTNMRVWLRHNPSGSPVPIGLFLKRMDRKVVTPRGIRTVCVTPRKITPREGDQSLWDTIQGYIDDPIGHRLPTPEEMPNKVELSILDGVLTEDQKLTWRIAAQMESATAEKEQDNSSEVKAFLIKAFLTTLTGSKSERIKALIERFGMSYPEAKEAVG